MSDPAIEATVKKTLFRQECAVSAVISATPEKIWRLLTDIDDMVRWNSTLTSMEGSTELGETVRMRVPEAPDRVFEVRVTKHKSNREMVWTQGNTVMFLGVRPPPHTQLARRDHLRNDRGLLRPDAADGSGRLPDFKPVFERYAAD